MLVVDMRVAQYHGQRFVAADALDGRKIDAGLNQFRNSGMAHDVRRDQLGIEPRALDRLVESPVHAGAVTGLAVLMPHSSRAGST